MRARTEAPRPSTTTSPPSAASSHRTSASRGQPLGPGGKQGFLRRRVGGRRGPASQSLRHGSERRTARYLGSRRLHRGAASAGRSLRRPAAACVRRRAVARRWNATRSAHRHNCRARRVGSPEIAPTHRCGRAARSRSPVSSGRARSQPATGLRPAGLHADWTARSPGEPYFAVTALWMLDDFHDINGATRVVPGSHRDTRPLPKSLRQPLARHPAEKVITGKAGSVLLFNGHLLHSGRKNASGSPRRAAQMVVLAADAIAGYVPRAT